MCVCFCIVYRAYGVFDAAAAVLCLEFGTILWRNLASNAVFVGTIVGLCHSHSRPKLCAMCDTIYVQCASKWAKSALERGRKIQFRHTERAGTRSYPNSYSHGSVRERARRMRVKSCDYDVLPEEEKART